MGRKIYVASSWRNIYQPSVVRTLRAAGHEVYDFKNPKPGDNGFRWSEIDPEWKNWDNDRFIHGLEHPVAESGFASDWSAMEWADTCVLALPCGRSAHLEAGYFVGTPGKELYILLPPPYDDSMGSAYLLSLGHTLTDTECDGCSDDVCRLSAPLDREEVLTRAQEPELMYKMADRICPNLRTVLSALESR